MSNKVVVLDLENNIPTAKMLRDIIEHFPTLYVFNGLGKFEYSLESLTELATWISSGQLIVLETPTVKEKEFEYAVIVGQLLALVESETHIEVISAMPSSEMLIQMMSASGLTCSLIYLNPESIEENTKYKMPSLDAIQQNADLQMIKKYCDAVHTMIGKPHTIEKLKNSIGNILQIQPEKSQHLVGMLINLKIIKHDQDRVSFRKKLLKQWIQLDLEPSTTDLAQKSTSLTKLAQVDSILAQLKTDNEPYVGDLEQQGSVQDIQNTLFKNFDVIDPMQMEVIRKLNQLKTNKPKDIYELRDLLEQMFPKSDVRLLLKELIEKGYIYWNGNAVVYSHEMFLN